MSRYMHDTNFARVQTVGATDREITETTKHVALNVLTNHGKKAALVATHGPVVEA